MSVRILNSAKSIKSGKQLLNKVWHYNIELPRTKLLFLITVAIGVIGWCIWQPQVLRIMDVYHSGTVEVFYMVESIQQDWISPELYSLLIYIAVAKIVWGVAVGLADLVFYKRLTGRAFDYANMLNMVVVNSLILFLGVYSFSLLPVENLIGNYDSFIASIPTIVHLDGVSAFLIAMLLGDFCFYWSHRMIHNVRVFWNLGHIYHHRNENLTQLTHGVEPRFFLLNAHGIASLMLLPLLAKLFTSDFSNAGYFLVPMALINLWIDPSHSVALYALENRYRPLKWLRLFFMKTCVHYTHHSRDPIHNKRTGCNFGARLTLWDRLFGTYVEPVNYIPESGLFSKHTDYCVNPMRYILQPYIRFIDEFKKNKLRYWPKILFGSVFWSPPNKSKLSH